MELKTTKPDGTVFQDPFGGGGAQGAFQYSKIIESLEVLHQQLTAKYQAPIVPQHAVTTHIMKELEYFQKANLQGISVDPRADNCYLWDVTVFGGEGTPWEGSVLSASLHFHHDHPLKPPMFRFSADIFHPNVRSDGLVCLDCLACDWKPDFSVVSILVSVQALLASPNLASCVNLEACKLLCTDKSAYRRKIRRLFDQ
eukprot:c10374_g1_i2.p1 GENE.c10374_g1_i2~~c10374_g1_i2.p1  ORF type:complete len:199 (+),score=45.01 c10374_g1_i2:825-1421(+)